MQLTQEHNDRIVCLYNTFKIMPFFCCKISRNHWV